MTTLFDPLNCGDLYLKNRIIMAPMTRGRADDAGVQPDIAALYYAQRASAGLIITEAVNIAPMSKANDHIPGIYTDAQAASWKKVTDAVHAAGGKICIQLFHTGRLSLPHLLPANAQPLAPSAVAAKGQTYTRQGMTDFVIPHELTVQEISSIIKDFVQAAQYAMAAGFDAVELHAAYGYLLHQFLGTNTNLRTDHYGGSDENRARFLFETIDAVKAVTGPGRLGLRLSPAVCLHDMEEDNARVRYAYIAGELNKRQLAYLHIALTGAQENERDWHDLLRKTYQGVYIANGGFNRESGALILAAGKADAIAYGRPFIANPDLPARFEKGSTLNLPDVTTFYTPGAKGYIDYDCMAADRQPA